MSFIAKNPLSAPIISKSPLAPIKGVRGLFPKDDGWYDINSNGEVKKITPTKVSELEDDMGLSSIKNTVTKLTTVSNEDDYFDVFEITESGTYMATLIGSTANLRLTHESTNPNKKFIAKVYLKAQTYDPISITGNYPIKYLKGEPIWTDSICWILDIEYDNQCNYFLVDAKYEGSESAPTKVSELENDSNYQSLSQVQKIVNEAIVSTGKAVFQKVDVLPSVDEAVENVLYLLPNGNKFDIFIKIDQEMIYLDDTDVDIDGYVTTEEFNEAVENMYTKEEINEMIGGVSTILEETLNYDIAEGGE